MLLDHELHLNIVARGVHAAADANSEGYSVVSATTFDVPMSTRWLSWRSTRKTHIVAFVVGYRPVAQDDPAALGKKRGYSRYEKKRSIVLRLCNLDSNGIYIESSCGATPTAGIAENMIDGGEKAHGAVRGGTYDCFRRLLP